MQLQKTQLIILALYTVDEYVKSLKGFSELQDKLAALHTEDSGNREPLFPEHWSPNRILAAVKSGKLLQGTFYASR